MNKRNRNKIKVKHQFYLESTWIVCWFNSELLGKLLKLVDSFNFKSEVFKDIAIYIIRTQIKSSPMPCVKTTTLNFNGHRCNFYVEQPE